MRRTIASLVLAAGVVGCDAAAPLGEPFALRTSWEPGSAAYPGACRPGWWAEGLLVVDPNGGTAMNVDGGDRPAGSTISVLWWPTFTGRRVGSEVAVLGPDGKVVATTGRRYRIEGSFEPIGFVACGDEVTAK